MRKMEAPLSPFLSLMKEKEAKENQGIRDACQVSRVLQTRQRGSCQVACIRPNFVGGRSRLDLLLPSFLLSREEKKSLFLRERKDLCQVAEDNHALEKSTRLTARLSIWGFFLIRKMKASLSPFLFLMRKKAAPLSPFLSLRKEKEAKENQGLTEAGEVAGDNHASGKSTRKTSPPSAEGLSLMKEKEAKENQGIRDACQVSRVLQTRQRGSC